MVLRYTLPFGNKENVKNLVFSILTKEYPLRIIELTNYIRKRYGKSVTFQAVRKATLELVSEKVIIQEGHEFIINKEWVLESKKNLDLLYADLSKGKHAPDDIQSIKGEISVFTFASINEMMKFWQDMIDDWYAGLTKGKKVLNCYQAAHAWEGLLHLDRERTLMGKLKNKGVISYLLSTGNTALDKSIRKFYRSIGVNMQISQSSSSFDKSFYIGTYGDTIIQAKYPAEIVDALDRFFRRNKTLEGLNLKELSIIVNKHIEAKLTIIKNAEMAEQINKSILAEM